VKGDERERKGESGGRGIAGQRLSELQCLLSDMEETPAKHASAICNLSTQEAEGGGSQVARQPGIHSETLSKKEGGGWGGRIGRRRRRRRRVVRRPE
jgi:hypothetical protein